MIALSIVAFAVYHAQQGAGAPPAPKQVLWPDTRVEAPSKELLDWHGWGYLKGVAGAESDLYKAAADWSSLGAIKPPSADASLPQWRIKAFVFRNVVRFGKDASGLLRTDRETIEDSQMAEVRRALQRLPLLMQRATKSKLRPVLDIVEEDEPIRADLSSGLLGAAFAQKYLAPRVNGGGYEAEDKVYRGPYSSVFCLLPGAVRPTPVDGQIYGMPFTVRSIEDATAPFGPGSLDGSLWADTQRHIEAQASAKGFAGLKLDSGVGEENWAELGISKTPTVAERIQRAKSRLPFVLDATTVEGPGYLPTWRSPSTTAELVTDVEKGSVLKVTMKGSTRGHGLAFPKRSDGVSNVFLEDGKTLNVTIRTVSRDPIAIRMEGKDGQRMWVALNGEWAFADDPQWPIVVAPVVPNGAWQTLAIDIGGIADQAGIKEITGLSLEFTPRSRRLSRTGADPIEVFISDIHFGKEPVSAPPDEPTEGEKRALTALNASKASAELLAALNDRNGLVRLNAADAYTRIKDLDAEPALGNLAIGIDAIIAERALAALAFQGTDTAWAMIRRSVRSSLNDQNKAAAGLLLGGTKDPRYNGDLSTLLANRSWQTRLAAVRALELMGTREAAIIRLAFIAQENPEIKLAVTQAVDAKDEPQVRRLLWSAVNEPLDLIRASSAIKLIESPIEALRKEGYKSVRDDSPTVRRLVLESLTAKPNEIHRPAIRIGIADTNPAVRAAAVRAFGALEGGASAEELAPAMEDASEEVSLALIEFAKLRKVALSAAVVARLKESPFASVREAAKSLDATENLMSYAGIHLNLISQSRPAAFSA